MKRILSFLILLGRFGGNGQTCQALFSYGKQFETVSFQNQSIVSNAHYYWNFGDGTSSYFTNPIHEFPGNGNYLVTLYVHDLTNSCSHFYDQWINVSKNYSSPCIMNVSDSIYQDNNGFAGSGYYLKIIDNSTGCGSLVNNYYSVGGNKQSKYFQLGTMTAQLK